MWQIKTFDTLAAMRAWIAKNEGRIQWREVFIENGYGVEWRKLRMIF
jgi:hypothetical protein